MKGQGLQPAGLAKPEGPHSLVVVTGDLVFTSGQVAFDGDGSVVGEDIETQARQTFDNMGLCLKAAGCGFEDVVKVNVFLIEFADYEAFKDVYRQYFKEPYPARTTVQVGLAPGLRIEVEAIARKPS
jgi:2-iminobutanoate/2-iminopropanoate deaminase